MEDLERLREFTKRYFFLFLLQFQLTNSMKHFFTLLAVLLVTLNTYAQVGINNETPDASSALDITSNTAGLLMPRMTETQRNAITTPATGLIVYQIDGTTGFYFYDGVSWDKMVVASTISSTASISFFTDLNDTYGSGTAAPMVLSFDLSPLGYGLFGWPILPHGAGVYFNTFDRYIGGQPSHLSPVTYGKLIPEIYDGGEILSGTISYQNNSTTNYRVLLANYTTSETKLIGTALANSFGSFEVSLDSGSGINLNSQDYIGICVEDNSEGGNLPPKVLIEGSLYFN